MKRSPALNLPSAIVGWTILVQTLSAAPGDHDLNFGIGGGLTASFTTGDDHAHSVALQPDGKILMAGGSAVGDYSVLRLLPGGDPDPDFGTAGKAVHSFGLFELARGVAAVGDGKILVGGSGVVGGSRAFTMMRLLPNGSLDSGYGTGGIVSTVLEAGFNDHAFGMVVDSGGRATLAGYHRNDFALVRYTASGAPDSSFGTGGKVFSSTTAAVSQQANAIALQSDGKVVIAGQSMTGSNTDIVVARYLGNGAPDPDFGTAGKTLTAIGPGNAPDVANSVAILPNEDILVAGTSGGDCVLLRYSPTGVLDPSFGVNGIASAGVAGASGHGLAVQSDGMILVAGTYTASGRDYFALFRFTSGGVPDAGFQGGGVATELTSGSDSGRAIALQSDRRVLVAGYAGALNARDFGIVRYESESPVSQSAWRQIHFGTTANSGDAADDFDFDKDGLVNLLEYAFSQNPRQGSSCAVPAGEASGGGFSSRFSVPASITGITYSAEWSASMAANIWLPATDTGSGNLHTFLVPTAGQNKVFLRWKITPQ